MNFLHRTAVASPRWPYIVNRVKMHAQQSHALSAGPGYVHALLEPVSFQTIAKAVQWTSRASHPNGQKFKDLYNG